MALGKRMDPNKLRELLRSKIGPDEYDEKMARLEQDLLVPSQDCWHRANGSRQN